MNSGVLQVDHVSKSFGSGLFSRRRVLAVDDVSFSVAPEAPEIFTIIGESGSGKTTMARMILGLEKPSSGSITLDGVDVTSIAGRARRMEFMAKVQPVFQNPFEAFNPMRRVDYYLHTTARRFADPGHGVATDAAVDLALAKVGLSLAEIAARYPHELSGGQLQRIAIARALIANPRLVVADEPVSMVDASLRMSIVNLLRSIRDTLRISVLYITHDIATAYYISDRIMIMRSGRVVEAGPARAVLANPKHEYTQSLKDAVLSPDIELAAEPRAART